MSTATSTDEIVSQPISPRRRGGCLSLFRRGLKWFGIVLVAVVLLGVVYQAVAIELDKRNYSPRGEMYLVNGHQMHMVCTGEGSPAVVLEAGGIANSLWWYHIQNQLATHTTVCAYDRAGQGWSEPAEGSRDALTLVNELHTLLEQAEIPAPYVMAGHSFGAILTRIYAQQYPDQVSGIVLVDSGLLIPKQFDSYGDFGAWKSSNDILQALLWGMTRTGVMRLMMPGQFQAWGYPANVAGELAALRSTNQALDSDYAERLPARWALNEASADAERLGDLPMMVLWATEGINFTGSDLERLNEAQQDVAAYATNSVTRRVEGADHGTILGTEIYAQQVTDAILDVIEAAQAGEPLTK